MKLAEPKILYKDIVINNNNIDDFLNTPHGARIIMTQTL